LLADAPAGAGDDDDFAKETPLSLSFHARTATALLRNPVVSIAVIVRTVISPGPKLAY
jgi:hypothetical protein